MLGVSMRESVRRAVATLVSDEQLLSLVIAAIVGVASGAAAGALLAWIEYATSLFPHGADFISARRWILIPLVPVVGGLLAGALRTIGRRLVKQQLVAGVVGVIAALARDRGVIRGRQAVVVGLGTGITIGSGGSCGYEGPSVAIGAAVGSSLARWFGLGPEQRITMLGAGCAGGLAAAFDAPLAGVVFTIEIVFRGAIGGPIGRMSMLMPLVVAAVAGTFTSHSIRGVHPAFAHASFASPDAIAVLPYVVLALAAGVTGTLMTRTLLAVTQWFRARAWPTWSKPAIGALAVGLVAASSSTAVLGAGHATVASALQGDLVWSTAVLFGILKIATTAITLGSGGFGGVLMPSLYVGAMLGTVYGSVVTMTFATLPHSPGAFAAVGMGAILAATMHAPLTPIVALFELTLDHTIIVPSMVCCILSAFVARRLRPQSLVHSEVVDEGIVLEPQPDREILRRHLVRDVMTATDRVCRPDCPLDEIRRASVDADSMTTFVVGDDGTLVGYIDGKGLGRLTLAGPIRPECTAAELMSSRRMALLLASDTIAGAMTAAARSEMEVMPVVDETRRLVGIVRSTDLLQLYSDRVLDESEPELPLPLAPDRSGPELALGGGMVLERIVVARGWAGCTLEQLQLRTRLGCTAMEWLRDDGILAVDARAALREGDVLALAGTRAQIRAARRDATRHRARPS